MLLLPALTTVLLASGTGKHQPAMMGQSPGRLPFSISRQQRRGVSSLLPRGIVAQRNLLDGDGVPSKPGWKSGRLDRLTDWAASKQANRDVICQYEPSSSFLWFRWKGTVLKLTIRSVLLSMLLGLAVDCTVRSLAVQRWPRFAVPPSTDPIVAGLEGLRRLWGYQFTLATFILTFFTSEAYGYWQKVYNTTRAIQGRINDICMLITMAAQRVTNTQNKPNKYSRKAENLVRLCSRLIRVSHIFFWAATPTASNGLSDCDKFISDTANCPLPIDDEHIGPLLLSPYGLKALANTGQLTQSEVDGLKRSGLPPHEYHLVLLTWVGMHAMNGLKQGILACGNGFEENLLRQITALRGEYFNIDDFRAGRMPLAYVQLVQVLVDSLVFLAPCALYPELGFLSIPLAGLMTLFFKGLMELSKSFLDPFGVEGFPGQNIRVDVLVSELNFGAGSRWFQAGERLPLPPED